MANLSSHFQTTKHLPEERVLMQMALGSMFSGLIATEIPETIYIEQRSEYKGEVKADQEFEIRVTVKEIVQRNRRATFETLILTNENGKPTEAIKGTALVKLPEYAIC
eukprot:TRINITY_DN5168_c0_g1_i1.p1 TRINITY_DN5168_c0_g1~~TRINITY_DN5168_c0_g1_i1.p1  ORF type:complete len:108 (+),score=19.92 TRINITY_DN5168_c0_g1_i1:266-589(+)